MYDHWVEPGFPYNVGKIFDRIFFQELHASGQSVVLKTIFINVSSYTCSQSNSDGSVLKQSN